MFRVEKNIDFCYGHRLLNYQGKCANLHGHNGRAIIIIERELLDSRGMVMDFSDIKRLISRWIDEHLDHQMIIHKDDPLLPVLRDFRQPCYVIDDNPTAENIAKLIFEQARALHLPVAEVRLWETESSVASYRGS